MLQNILVQLGFTNQESLLYALLLDYGPASAPELSKLSTIGRTYIYRLCQNLSSFNLVKISHTKNITFTATSPESLVHLIKQKQRELDLLDQQVSQLLPELTRHYTLIHKKPLIQYLATLKTSTKTPEQIHSDIEKIIGGGD